MHTILWHLIHLLVFFLSAGGESYIDHTEGIENNYSYTEDGIIHLYSDSYDAPSLSGDLFIYQVSNFITHFCFPFLARDAFDIAMMFVCLSICLSVWDWHAL